MFKKYLVITHKNNIAGMNIIKNLEQFRKHPVLSGISDAPMFDVYITEEEALYEEHLDKEKINKYDFVIFAYTHKSEKGEKSLSIHAPGNFRDAKLGGKMKKLSPTSALFQKFMFTTLQKNMKEYTLDEKYALTLEVTHHGPLIEKPCLFIEIGSSIEEHKDRRAGFVVAKTIVESIEHFKENPYHEVAIALGGPHYCPSFNKIQLNSNVALSHVIPNYVAPITEEMVREALEKTHEEVDFAVVDWKGLGNAEQRKAVLDILDTLYIQYKKTGEISK